jgi:hypothetical protein
MVDPVRPKKKIHEWGGLYVYCLCFLFLWWVILDDASDTEKWEKVRAISAADYGVSAMTAECVRNISDTSPWCKDVREHVVSLIHYHCYEFPVYTSNICGRLKITSTDAAKQYCLANADVTDEWCVKWREAQQPMEPNSLKGLESAMEGDVY